MPCSVAIMISIHIVRGAWEHEEEFTYLLPKLSIALASLAITTACTHTLQEHMRRYQHPACHGGRGGLFLAQTLSVAAAVPGRVVVMHNKAWWYLW